MKISRKKLEKLLPEFTLRIFDETDSTNTVAKGEKIYTLVTATSQSGGRGRSGKSFFSPKGGVYMSLVMPDINIATVRVVTAVCNSLEKYSRDSLAVKWVNDIFSGGKKISGILTEKVGDRLILGIGININRKKFPEDIAEIAGAVTVLCSKEELIATIAKEVLAVWSMPKETVIAQYRKRLFVIGKRIEYVKNGEKHSGIAEDINSDANLIVSENGKREILNSGEISLGSNNFKK